MAENKSLRAGLRAAMAAMSNPTKDTNAFKYKYAQLDQVLGIIREPLQEQGLDVRQSRCDGKLLTIVFNDDEELVLDERPLLDGKDPQVLGSFETYMRRYALQTAFSLAASDDDGQFAKDGAKAQQRHAQAAQGANPAQPTMQQRISEGVSRLASVSPMDADSIRVVISGLGEQEALNWLISEYKSATAQLNGA